MFSLKKNAAFLFTLIFLGSSATLSAQTPQMNNAPMQSSPSQMHQPMQSSPSQTNQNQMQPTQSEPRSMDQKQSSPMSQPNNQNMNQSSKPLNLNQGKTAEKVSDAELKKFAGAYKKVQEKSKESQKEMAAVIQKDGMDLQRFNELQTEKMQNKKMDATKEEKKAFKKVTKDLDAMQPKLQKDLKSTIKSTGFSVERFQAIASAIQNDAALKSRFQKVMGGGNS